MATRRRASSGAGVGGSGPSSPSAAAVRDGDGKPPSSPARPPPSTSSGSSWRSRDATPEGGSRGRITRAKSDELESKKRRALAALLRLRAGRVFNAYVRLWAVAQLVRLYADGAYDDADATHRASSRWGYVQMGFCAASLVSPWRTRVIVAGAFYSRVVDVFFRFPRGATGVDVAAVLFDASVTLCLAGHVTGLIATWPRVVDAAGRAVRSQLAWLHLLRGFWKLNTSYLNRKTSCAPIFAAQLLDAYAPTAVTWTNRTATAVISAAPYWIIALELAVGTCALCGQGRTGRLGAALGLMLCLGSAMLPPPNGGVSGKGLGCRV